MEVCVIRTAADFMKTHKHAWLALYFVVFVIAFFVIEKHTPTEGYWVTDLPADDHIPFIPQFIFAYVMWYPLFVAVGVPLLIWDGPAFKRYMYFTMTGLTACLVFCVAVPNGQNLRPTDMQVTDLATWLLARIWAADTNTNVFPSMHVFCCFGAVFGTFDSRIFKKWRWLFMAVAVVIAASTVFVKQHALLDAVGAAGLAIVLFFIFYSRRFFGRGRKEEPAA